MVLKTVNVENPVDGDLKFTTHFAWLPKKVANQVIWLHKYQRLFEYKVRERYRVYTAMHNSLRGTWGEWELISEKAI
jgi:hypothetical protein